MSFNLELGLYFRAKCGATHEADRVEHRNHGGSEEVL